MAMNFLCLNLNFVNRRDMVTLTESRGEDVEYDVGLPVIKALIDQSAFCYQYVELQCTVSVVKYSALIYYDHHHRCRHRH